MCSGAPSPRICRVPPHPALAAWHSTALVITGSGLLCFFLPVQVVDIAPGNVEVRRRPGSLGTLAAALGALAAGCCLLRVGTHLPIKHGLPPSCSCAAAPCAAAAHRHG